MLKDNLIFLVPYHEHALNDFIQGGHRQYEMHCKFLNLKIFVRITHSADYEVVCTYS